MSVLFQESNGKTAGISLQPDDDNNNNRVLASICLNMSLTCALIHIQVLLESRAPPCTGLTELSYTLCLRAMKLGVNSSGE